ncbi:hypothetical protein OS493_023924 [Desmophyllum pertusum]|uniref:Uncharacterized protein n=1 Tax=Desmophyllum pertusum TaxID=174260 RepID=A0A9W9YAD6_9CNID|nr:hypothetical protein OS493_023924 [Desmophyllum pertusum]
MSRVCVACNSKILGSSSSCVCGHVFIEKRSIGGRRFSEYRANLYTRLTMAKRRRERKSRYDMKETRPAIIVKQLDQRKIMSIMSSKRKTNTPLQQKAQVKKPEKESKAQQDNKKKSHRFFATDEVMATRTKPEKNASRLAHALEEINRRLLSQQLVWFSL